MSTGPTTVGSQASVARSPDARLVELRGAHWNPAPGEPGYLFHRVIGWMQAAPGGQQLTMKAANWQVPSRTGRDGRRAIGQDQPPMVDPADFRRWVTSFTGDYGFAASVDKRQPDVEASQTAPYALAIDQSRDALGDFLDPFIFGAASAGINATTMTGEVGTLTPGTAGSGPIDATAAKWSTTTTDIEGQLVQCIDAYQRERRTVPNAIMLGGSALLAASRNDGFRPVTERVGGSGLAIDSFGRLGLRNVYVGVDGVSISAGTVVLFREDGTDPRLDYRPFVGSWCPIADYMMETLGDSGLGIGVHMWPSAAGSIEYARVAAMVDTVFDNLGLARIINAM